jgi:hypothetical protein
MNSGLESIKSYEIYDGVKRLFQGIGKHGKIE